MNAPTQHPTAIRTTCPYCGVGCGVLAGPDGRSGAVIAGDPEHPANFGRLCSKGTALGETLGLAHRLLHPMLRQPDGALAQVSWDAAIDRVAIGFADTLATHGPDSIAFYLSGQLLTEDYYVANKLMKGFLGSANVDTNSRLCMASSVAGHRRAFGSDTVPGCYEDLDEADLIILVGSNAAWCHPVLYQRIVASRGRRGAKLVVIDPRRTATAENADLFLPIAPGMDAALFSGLFAHLADTLGFDYAYIDRHTAGLTEALARAREIAPDVQATAARTGLDAADIVRFFELFRTTPRVVTCYSQGVNQSAQGTDKVNAIINCHLATGRIGKIGMGPLSLTGQPNAMGGREVGGLANQLAAHMDFTPREIDRVGRFWRAPQIARREGLKAVPLFEAIERGQINALWVMATNPAVSLPRAAAIRRALGKLDLFVVSENVRDNDTVNAGAHVLLPAAAWGEKDGTVTNSERRISRQRPFLPLPGEAKPDWWIVTEVARRLGFASAFPYRGTADIFRENAALSAFENGGTRDFDLGAVASLSDGDFEALTPMQWPARVQARPEKRLFGRGGYFTNDGRARFATIERPSPKSLLSRQFRYRLNTGRIRDQWHTMTRSGLSPRLANHQPEPFVEVNPGDAAKARLIDGGFARVTTAHGSCTLRVLVSAGQQPGSLFVPIHWSDETASSARVCDLVMSNCDPISGQPEAKATPAAIAPIEYRYRGFALGMAACDLPRDTWWARVTLRSGFGHLVAGDHELQVWRERAGAAFGGLELAEYVDEAGGIFRAAAFSAGRLQRCIFIGPADAPPRWDSLSDLYGADSLAPAQRRAVLTGREASDRPSQGPQVCACFGVGRAAIEAVIASGARSTEAIGARLRAGTNCGSCLPEIRAALAASIPDAVTTGARDSKSDS